MKFKIVPWFERYYSENTNFGVYDFLTDEDIPQYEEYYEDIFSNDLFRRKSILSGNMQRLYIGSEYEITATVEYNAKYNSYQYKPKTVVAIAPKSFEQQRKFLESILTPRQASTLLDKYPSIVEDVVNGNDYVDLHKLKGIGEQTWESIKEKIIGNYVISDIVVLLQPLGVSFNMIKKLLSDESNPTLLKKKLLENPYIMTKIRGLGFKTVDALALKLNPNMRVSRKRTYAFVNYYLRKVGEEQGHTWIKLSELENAVRDNINECMDEYYSLLEEEKHDAFYKENGFLHISEDHVGLKNYYETEKSIYDILTHLNSMDNILDDVDIESAICEAEAEQGFSLTEEQRSIVYEGIKHNVVLISGSAGTGKTTLVRTFLKAYKKYSVACCALSAKAAQRITEATGFPSSTIHRLLGAQGIDFTYNHDNPLQKEVIFCDECSMVNSSIFYALVSAVKDGGKLILCGDDRQLPPIGYGNVFSDLLKKKDKFNVNKLTTVHRQAQKSGILSDANMIRIGVSPIKQPELKIVSGELRDMVYMFRDSREALRDIAVRTYLKSVEEDGLDDVVIITPRKEKCPNSTLEINKIIQNELIPNNVSELRYGKKKFKLGAKVIQRTNNYDKNVFNGEIGYIKNIWTEQDGKEKVSRFEVEYKLNDSIKEITYSQNELDQIDLAYALTVHLSQGSGYKTVISIIDNTHYALLDTCLLYTALTRAKKRCLLLSEPTAFKRCVFTNKSIDRQTWLKNM